MLQVISSSIDLSDRSPVVSFFCIHYCYLWLFFLVKCFEPTFNDEEKCYTNQHTIIIIVQRMSKLKWLSFKLSSIFNILNIHVSVCHESVLWDQHTNQVIRLWEESAVFWQEIPYRINSMEHVNGTRRGRKMFCWI